MGILTQKLEQFLLLLVLIVSVSCNPLDNRQGSTVGANFTAGLQEGKFPDTMELEGRLESSSFTYAQHPRITLIVRDKLHAPVSGAEVILETESGTATATSSTTNNEGKIMIDWTFGGVSGEASLKVIARLNGFEASETLKVNLALSTVSVANSTITGTSSIVANGSTYSVVTINLKNSSGDGVPDITPLFSATDTGSTNAYSACSASDSNGISTCQFSSRKAETKTLRLLSPVSMNGGAVTFIPGPMTALSFTTLPVASSTDSPLTTQPVVKGLDQYQNIVTNDSTSVVSITPYSGVSCTGSLSTAHLSGTISMSLMNGVASFTNISLLNTSIKSLEASSGTIKVCSNSISVTAGAASSIALTTQPVASDTDTLFSPQPVVTAYDAQGNILTNNSSSSVTMTAYDGPSCAGSVITSSIGGTVLQTLSSGIATFTNLRPLKTSIKSIKATMGALSACSNTLTVAPGIANSIGFSTGPSITGNTDTNLSTQPVVSVYDSSGNTKTDSAATITLTAYSDTSCSTVVTGGLTATSNPVTATNGVATFSGVRILKTNVMRIGASDGTRSTCSSALSISSGAPANLSISSGNSQSATVNTGLSAFSVLVTDANLNAISGVTINWSVLTGGGSLSTSSSSTNASGLASSTLTLGTTAGSNTVSATINGTSTTVNFAATGTAGQPASISISSGNAQTGTAGSPLAQSFSVLVQDAFSNNISGATINWAIVTGGGSLSSSASTTNSSGLASSTLTLGTVAGANSVSATVNGQSLLTQTFTATGVAGSPTQIAIVSGNNQSANLGSTLSSALTVNLKDANNNNVNNATVNWSISSGTLGSSSSVTASTGNTSTTVTVGTSSGAQTVTATINGTTTNVTFNFTAIIQAPSGLSGTNGDASSALSWTATTGASSYKIYSSTTNGSGYTLLGTSFTNSYSASLTNGTTYYIVVTAINGSNESSNSSQITVRPAAPPSLPNNIAGTVSSQQVVLTWTAPSTGTSPFTYNIYRSTSSGTGFSSIATSVSALTYTDSSLTNGQTYYYKITAVNSNSESSYTSEIALTPDYVPTLGFTFNNSSPFQPHNIFTYSSNLSDASWTKSETTITSNAATAPDGSFTAQKIVETSANTPHAVIKTPTYVTGNTYTMSLYAKAAENRYIQLFLTSVGFGANAYANYDLQTGTVTATGSSATSSIHSVGNGWYRCIITATATGSGAGNTGPHLTNSGTAGRGPTYTGTAGNGLYVWGLQLEINPGVSRYVATTTSTATTFTSPLLGSDNSNTLTFTRSDTALAATMFGSDGKLRYSPHNMLQKSDAFDDAYWSKVRTSITANATTAPDGTLTADKIIEDTSANIDHAVYRSSLTISSTGIYTFSVFLKAAERTKVMIVSGDSTWTNKLHATVDLSAGTVSTNPVGSISSTSANIISVGNGWYRVSMRYSIPNTTALAALYPINPGSSYTGDGTSGFYAWGAQYEQNLFPSFYVPTTTAAVYSSPRYDFEPSTLKPLGLLMEASASNYMTYSDQFDNAAWYLSNATITANALTAPDGTTTADKLVEDATSSIAHKIVRGNYSGTAAVTYTGSIYLKAAERTKGSIQLSNASLWPTGANPNIYFDLSTCAVTSSSNVLSSAARSVGSGWCRLSLSQTLNTAGSIGINVLIGDAANSIIYNGDGVSGMYLWGGQLEGNSAATSYIPTVGSIITRNAENMTAASTSWFDANNGTFQTEYSEGTARSGTRLIYLSNTTANVIFIGGRTGGGQLIQENTKVSSTDVCQIFGTTASYGTTTKLISAYASGNYASAVNGTLSTTSTAGAIPSINTINFGSAGSNGQLNGWIGKINYFNTRLLNSDVQRLSQ